VISLLPGMPAGTLGFRVTDDIEREDYKNVLEPELRKALEAGSGLRAVYVIEDLDDIESGALWEDMKTTWDLGVGHHKAWERSAIVTDIDWMVRASKLFAWMIPGEARVFGLNELEEAKRWVAGLSGP
jgi:hypothetical protein